MSDGHLAHEAHPQRLQIVALVVAACVGAFFLQRELIYRVAIPGWVVRHRVTAAKDEAPLRFAYRAPPSEEETSAPRRAILYLRGGGCIYTDPAQSGVLALAKHTGSDLTICEHRGYHLNSGRATPERCIASALAAANRC